MEHHHDKLATAIQQLPSYEPSDLVWENINDNLNELPLKEGVDSLSGYEPNEQIWANIEQEIAPKKAQTPYWRAAAAVILIGTSLSIWFLQQNTDKKISYSEELMDERLQIANSSETDDEYYKIKQLCEAETVVCSSKGFKQLKEEYETLQIASQQLQTAMGQYNSEPELVRQLSMVEQEKAGILNKMAKMI